MARNEEFKELVKNIAMHIAASAPKYVAPADIPGRDLEQERDIAREQFKDSKKPPAIIEKIVEGKLTKFYEEVCLLEQPTSRTTSSRSRTSSSSSSPSSRKTPRSAGSSGSRSRSEAAMDAPRRRLRRASC